MKYNPKVVPFDRSAAYVHHRALKNRRDNNPLDALELMRHAVEHSPENREYLLDLAELYCELGCHEQSNRILLDILAGPDAPSECYYGLALNQFGRNELESARRALDLYRNRAGGGEYDEDATSLFAEIELYDAMQKPLNRKIGRAVQQGRRACEALREDEPERACRLFEKSLQKYAGQPEMRALYAMALRLCGRGADALREARLSAQREDASVRALSTAAQVLRLCGELEEARALARRASAQRAEGVELRLLALAMSELEMYAEAADAAKAALREAPYDKELLHLRAATLHRAGAPDSQVEPFWLRILRMDPSDSVARFYHEAALRGALDENEPELAYEVPGAEYRRRLVEIADSLSGGLPAALEKWETDREFRDELIWAVGTGDENCGRAAMMVIAMAKSPESESVLRELMYRSAVPASVKMHAALVLRMRGANLKKFMPPDFDPRDGMLPEADEILRRLPVGERQLVRFAAEVMELEYGIRPLPALAALWYAYHCGRGQGGDPLMRTQEAAAALAWNYLLAHGEKVSVGKLARQFACNPRRMVYYARHMAAVLEQSEGERKDEDH